MRNTLRYAVAFIVLAGVLVEAPVGAGTPTAVVVPQTVTVHGDVRDEQGALLPGACISARSSATTVLASACADAQGRYTLAVPEGVRFGVMGQLAGRTDAWSGEVMAPDWSSAIRYIGYGDATIEPDVILLPAGAGTIAGRVTDHLGTALANVAIEIGLSDGAGGGAPYAYTFTDADGRYRQGNLPATPFQYEIRVGTVARPGLVTVAPGQEAVADFALTAPVAVARLQPKLPDGSPAVNACVDVSQGALGGRVCRGSGEGFGFVLSTGGTWKLSWSDTSSAVFPLDTTLTAGLGAEVAHDVVLKPAALVQLRRVDAVTGHEISGFSPCPALITPRTNWWSTPTLPYQPSPCAVPQQTNPRGVHVFDPGAGASYGAQWVGGDGRGTGDERLAKLFQLRPGVNGIVIRLDHPGAIRASVWDAARGEPAAGACGTIATHLVGAPYGCAGANGLLTITGLGPYAWPVVFTGEGYATMWSGQVAQPRSAKLVQVTVGGFTPVEMTMTPQGRISVTNAFGSSRCGETAYLYDALTGDLVSAPSACDVFSISRLASGRYFLRYVGANHDCWYAVPGWAGRRMFAITVTGGSTTTVSINAATCVAGPPQLLTAPPRRVLRRSGGPASRRGFW